VDRAGSARRSVNGVVGKSHVEDVVVRRGAG